MSGRQWLLDLDRSVRRVLTRRHGGTGNEHGWAAAVVQPFPNGDDGTLPVGSVVSLRAGTAPDRRVRRAATADGTDVLGVVVGTFTDGDGTFVATDPTQYATAAVMTQGVCSVLVSAAVTMGEYAYVHSTDGTAKSSATVGAGAFGRFLENASSGSALVSIGMFGGGGGGSGSLDFGEVGDIAASAPGDTALAGSTGEVADAGHRHARESHATLTAALDYGGAGDIAASAPGDTVLAGSTGEVADAGHRHAREAKETSGLTFVIDGGGSVPATGVKLFGAVIEFPCTVTGWTVLSDLAGTCTFDVWKDAYANHPPTVADSMVGAGTKPNIAGPSRKGQSYALDWTTTALAAGDVLFLNLDAVATCTWLSITLRLRRDGSG
jgi:hypothetical protein